MDFEEYVSANYKRLEGQTRGLVEDAFGAGQQSKQAEIDALKKKYDAMYNAFVVANDCRKEWHGCFTRVKEEKDRLQSMINLALTQVSNHYHSCVARKNLKQMSASTSEISEIEVHELNMQALKNILKGE